MAEKAASTGMVKFTVALVTGSGSPELDKKDIWYTLVSMPRNPPFGYWVESLVPRWYRGQPSDAIDDSLKEEISIVNSPKVRALFVVN